LLQKPEKTRGTKQTPKKTENKTRKNNPPRAPASMSWKKANARSKQVAASVPASDSVLREMRVFMPVCVGAGLDRNKICPIDVDRRYAWEDSWIPEWTAQVNRSCVAAATWRFERSQGLANRIDRAKFPFLGRHYGEA
jgi:hypothetical protein